MAIRSQSHSHGRLEVRFSDGQTTNVRIEDASIVLGRDSSCNVVVSGNLKTISRKHAEIFHENGLYFIRDLGSQNGVFVNQMRIENDTTLVCEIGKAM